MLADVDVNTVHGRSIDHRHAPVGVDVSWAIGNERDDSAGSTLTSNVVIRQRRNGHPTLLVLLDVALQRVSSDKPSRADWT